MTTAAAPQTGKAKDSRLAEYPAERRIQMLALGTLVAAVAVDAVLVGFDDLRLLGYAVPGTAMLGVLALALLLGVVAVVRRDLRVLAAAVVALIVPALAERAWEVTPYRFVGSVLFGFLVLMFGELVHMTTRYEKWHRVADERHTGAEGLDHATEEYLHTFTTVFGASAVVALVVGAVFGALTLFGPAQHRASLDFRSFYGLVGAAAIVFGALGLLALARGADWSLITRRPASAAESHTPAQPEVDVDDLQ